MAKYTPLVLIIVFSSVFTHLHSQIISYPVAKLSQNKNAEGFVYTLPKNIVKVDVYVTKTEEFKGQYSDFATKLLGITDPISKDAVSFDISRVQISTQAIPDTSHVYFAEIPSKGEDDRQIMLNLTNDGFISGFTTNYKEKSYASKNAGVISPFSDLLKPVMIEKVDTIIRKVSIDTSTFIEKIPRRSISEKSIEQQAKEIADQIYKLEDSKYKLITGYQEVNYSSESIELMLDKLNALEKDYLTHFKGSTVTTESIYTYYYIPDGTIDNAIFTLFRFTSSEGITSKENTTGDPVSITVSSLKTLAAAKPVEMNRMANRKKAGGIYYRIPELAEITINLGGRALANEKLRINQLGILTCLPANNISHVAFDDAGALKTLIIQ